MSVKLQVSYYVHTNKSELNGNHVAPHDGGFLYLDRYWHFHTDVFCKIKSHLKHHTKSQ
jgi:hypothetical protein